MSSLDASFPSTSNWSVELPPVEAKDSDFGGCRSIEGNYTRDTQIGEGTYGEVYLATNTRTKEKVALKKIRMDNEKEGFPITAIREIKLLKRLDNENVITLKEIVRSRAHQINNMKGSIYMVFDYMDHDLTGLMERRNYKMEVSHVKCYMKQLLKGLNFCHGKHILHRDLKASNLLINNSGILKIADFGLARTKDETTQKGRLTNRVITLWYRPPELILGSTEYGPEIDIWSVGCIFAELLSGQPLFPGKDEADQLDRICKVMGTPTEQTMPGFSKLTHAHMLNDGRQKENRLRKHLQSKKINDPNALDLLCQLLEMNPAKRISAQKAAMHIYFWSEPLPAEPKDLPKYAASHELDMKKLRQDAKHKHSGAGKSGPESKRMRLMDPQAAARPPGDAIHHARSGDQLHHDSRSQRYGSSYRQDGWDARTGYSEHAPSSSGRQYDSRFYDQNPPAVPPASYVPGYAGFGGRGGYAAGLPRGGASYGAAGYMPAPNAPGAFDSTGYPIPGGASQAYKGHGSQQQELGAQPSWLNKRR